MIARIRKLFNPELFQGNLNRGNYFEGWYFKNVSPSLEEAVAFIPGVSISNDPHSFILYIDGTTGETESFRYPLSQFTADPKKFRVTIGDSFFSRDEISLNIENERFNIEGSLKYRDHILFPRTLLTPGIMGWYSYVPGMECNHGVVSLNNTIGGVLSINGTDTQFTGGKGYIEKDWGVSFPESHIWLQCNNFDRPDVSLMFSIAKIPWRGKFFMGLIGFLTQEGQTELFASYNRSRVTTLKMLNDDETLLEVERGRRKLSVKIKKALSGVLAAPKMGSMTRSLKESISSEIDVEYRDKSGKITKLQGQRAGYEEDEKIFDYFPETI